MMLDEAFGEDRVFHQRFGYHADIVRPKVAKTFPAGWEDRLAPLESVRGVFCLEPHDMTAAKCLVGREKDRTQIAFLVGAGIVDPEIIGQRLSEVELGDGIVSKARVFLEELSG